MDEIGTLSQYEAVTNMFYRFLTQFEDESSVPVYVDLYQKLVNADKTTLFVNIDHVRLFLEELYAILIAQYYKYLDAITEAANRFAQDINARLETPIRNAEDVQKLHVSLYGCKTLTPLRSINTHRLGQLTAITGTVIRTSEIRPELTLASFRCLHCGAILDNVPQAFRYTEPKCCFQEDCKKLHPRAKFELVLHRSVFRDFQKLRIQESPHEVPSGSIPRCFDIISQHELVGRCKPGDKVLAHGCVCVVPDVRQMVSRPADGSASSREGTGAASSGGGGGTKDLDGITGLKYLGQRDLTYSMVFLASSLHPSASHPSENPSSNSAILDTFLSDISVQKEHLTAESLIAHLTPEQKKRILEMKNDKYIYKHLSESIAPHLYGHENIKRGLLFMLLGGVHKQTKENIKLRGDIHICIVGDPSTAKSQFLQYISDFIPRGVYTSGKAASAAGLTATVTRDPETNEHCIEAGALLLSDNGICCIDEFDKMDIKDMVAIHEVMEQQTITITKSGVKVTLNAKACILAAANPVAGKYDFSKTLRQNLNFTDAVLSRFDLFFVLPDKCNPESDAKLASHIINLHQYQQRTNLDRALSQANTAANSSSASAQTADEASAAETYTLDPMLTPSDRAELYDLIHDPDQVRCHTSEVRAPYSKSDLQLYIRFARTIQPVLTKEAMEMIPEMYLNLRSSYHKTIGAEKSAHIYGRTLPVTVRQLESLIRLSEAIARLHFDTYIRKEYVGHAFKLLDECVFALNQTQIQIQDTAASAGSLLHKVNNHHLYDQGTTALVHPHEHLVPSDAEVESDFEDEAEIEATEMDTAGFQEGHVSTEENLRKRKRLKRTAAEQSSSMASSLGEVDGTLSLQAYQEIVDDLLSYLKEIEQDHKTTRDLDKYMFKASRMGIGQWFLSKNIEKCQSERDIKRLFETISHVIDEMHHKEKLIMAVTKPSRSKPETTATFNLIDPSPSNHDDNLDDDNDDASIYYTIRPILDATTTTTKSKHRFKSESGSGSLPH